MPIARTRIPLVLLSAAGARAPRRRRGGSDAQEVDLGSGRGEGRLAVPDLQGPGCGHLAEPDQLVRRRAHAARQPADPRDPAYRWSPELGDAIAEGRRFGIRTSLVLSQAPAWASGHSDTRFVPRKPKDFADFAYAASARYRPSDTG